MAFVKASASCAPASTHLKLIPSLRTSLIERATNCTLNSEQEGGAARVIKSYRLLQSVIARWDSCGTVTTEIAGSTLRSASSGLFH